MRQFRPVARALSGSLIAFLLAWTAGTAAQDPPLAAEEPLDTGLTEEVEVRYVVLDALVLGPGGAVVTDLAPEDFELFLDLFPHEVESVDLDCPEGGFPEPAALEPGRTREKRVAPDVPRRIVHVIDYKNLPQTRRLEVLDRLDSMVRDYHTPAEELMIVAITRRLRIEQPFTRDRDALLATLARMREDPSLWQEQPIPHREEFALFDALTELIRLLSRHEGSKALVLFSDLPTKIEDAHGRPLLYTPVAFDYDVQFERVATAATDARVAIYPVHSRGLSVARSSHRLARFAAETGGRFTENTNDLSLAYLRAQRDLACRYAIGFRDSRTEEDRLHRVSLRVRRRGVRVIHPALYRFGSHGAAEASFADTAYSVPLAFRDRAVRGRIFPIRPGSAKTWTAAIALSFPVRIPAEGARTVRFGAKLDDAGRRAVHHFDSSVTVQGGGRAEERPFVVIEPIDLAPGSYDLSIVVNDPAAGEPRTAVVRVDLPPLPRHDVMVVEPLLIRPAPRDVEVQWNGEFESLGIRLDEGMLEPVFPGNRLSAAPLMALTRICWPRKGADRAPLRVERAVRIEGGPVRAGLRPLELAPPDPQDNPCVPVLDNVPTSRLQSGVYQWEVRVHLPGRAEPIRQSTRFELDVTAPVADEPDADSPALP